MHAEIFLPGGFIDLFLLFPLRVDPVFGQLALAQTIEDLFVFGFFHQILPGFLHLTLGGGDIFPLLGDVPFGGR